VSVWTILAEPGALGDGTNRPAMDVDPRRRIVRLGLRMTSGGEQEITSGAVARTFFDGDVLDWSRAAEWLAGDDANALLDAIAAGHDVATLWTGDLVVTWSEQALAAGRELHGRVLSAVAPPQ
jgi:hypothetical protein